MSASADRPFQGRLFSVRIDHTEQGDREIVEHPGSVAVIALDPDGRVALVRQHRQPAGHSLLEIPAGLRDVAGEPPEGTARRELMEECGLEPGGLRHLGAYYTSPGFSDERQDLFLATGVRAADGAETDGEVDELTWVPLAEAVAGIMAGEFEDLKTAAAILLAARLRST